MTPTLPQEVIDAMAGREHRLHHWLWHEVRNSWLSYPEDVRQQIRDLGWEPPRPALNERRRPILDNDAGEDFLYMHRRMLVDVSAILNRVKSPAYPRVWVWSEIPAPGDPDFPVPPAWFDPTAGDTDRDRRLGFETLQRIKSDIFYRKRMLYWQRLFRDHGFLRGITLGELGTLMELSVHASMHLRWASAPAGRRPEPGPTEGDTIASHWDDPRYDFLGDTYSSHVHPVFWSLHGWIDDRIEDWKVANGVYGNNFWKGTWAGPWPGETPAPPPDPVAVAPPATAAEPVAGETAPDPAPESPPTPVPAAQPASQHGAMAGHAASASAGSAPSAAAPMALAHHGDPGALEEAVKVIGRCGIFHRGYGPTAAHHT